MSADFTDTARAEERLRAAANKLHELVPDVAIARQVREFAGDRRKNVLATYMAPLMVVNSAPKAEALARANEDYQKHFDALCGQYLDACAAIAEWEATQATFDAARSLLSFSKEHLKTLDG